MNPYSALVPTQEMSERRQSHGFESLQAADRAYQ
jgi:hypothetical protein